MTPKTPGPYRYTPDMPGATPSRVEVVLYDGALMVRLPDGDEVELHPMGDLSGAWAPWTR
jgi:hypothetical protein